MKSSTLVTFVGAALIVYSFAAPWLTGEGSPPALPNPGDPDLLASFKKSDDTGQAASDARAFGHLCQALADMIAFDGRQAEPQLTTGVQLDNFRTLSRFYQTEGASYARRYPSLAETAGSYLESKLGNEGGPLSDAARARWVHAYEALSASAFYAAEVLEDN